MVGPTLIDIREHIDDLATEDGQYYIRCGRTGDQPVPAVSTRFPDRATARAAARATEQYRSALRRYDPQVPYYDLIVCEETNRDATVTQPRESATETPQHRLSEPVITDNTTPERRGLVEFCHRVAGAVFETFFEAGCDAIKSAVIDAYLELAETISDPDELCRHHSARPSQSVQVTTVDGGWQLTFVLADTGDQNGLVSAPVDGEV